jgi:general secretion pathway protein E
MTLHDRNSRSSPRGGKALWLTGIVLVLVMAEPAFASATFPRGTGFYYNPYKIVFFLAVYFSWIATCGWVSRDIDKLESPATLWTTLLLAAGLLGMAVVWVFPVFWVALFLFLAGYVGAALLYLKVRDGMVEPEHRLLTQENLRRLLRRHLRVSFPKRSRSSQVDGLDDLEEAEADAPAEIRFISRSAGGRDEDSGEDRTSRLQDSKGYRAAQAMIDAALKRRTTDVHLEPGEDNMSVRYRIDGMMANQEPLNRALGEAVLNVFKVIADLNITERRKPQDGAFSAEVDGRPVEFRVATAGSVNGEKMVIRVLDSSQQLLSLSQLGMRDKMRDQVLSLIKQPHGMFLACGPTGSGKSSSLYACLNEIDRYQQNVITIENPVEYRLDHVTQIEVSEKAGKTFAGELRSILRQDPDVILLGEIRDKETAEIACQAAQTGHMVFSTLHANDSVTAIGRLIDLGVEPFKLGTALSGILSQRLVRLLCPTCKKHYKPDPELLKKAGLPVDKIKFFHRPPNADERTDICPDCAGSGYSKRTGIFELLVLNDRIREMIKDKPNLQAIKQEAVKNGMRYLYEDGMRLVIEGKTSLKELMRVSK